jgi:hypothetical protein
MDTKNIIIPVTSATLENYLLAYKELSDEYSSGPTRTHKLILFAFEDALVTEINDMKTLETFVKGTRDTKGTLNEKLSIKKEFLIRKPKFVDETQKYLYDNQSITFYSALPHYHDVLERLKNLKLEVGYTRNIFDSVFKDYLSGIKSRILGLVGVPDKEEIDLNLRELYFLSERYNEEDLAIRVLEKYKSLDIPADKRLWHPPVRE